MKGISVCRHENNTKMNLREINWTELPQDTV